MTTIRNEFRSKVHKAYNREKLEYQYWENKIIQYKNGTYGIDPKLLNRNNRR